MKIEFQDYITPSERPDVGDVINFENFPDKAVLLVSSNSGYMLVDLSDGYQMWNSKDTISELMEHTDQSWIILKNAKVVAG